MWNPDLRGPTKLPGDESVLEDLRVGVEGREQGDTK